MRTFEMSSFRIAFSVDEDLAIAFREQPEASRGERLHRCVHPRTIQIHVN